MTRARQERIKLLATYLNTIAAGLVVTGIVAPSAAVVVNPGLGSSSIVYLVVLAFLLSLTFHASSQAVLGMLGDDDT